MSQDTTFAQWQRQCNKKQNQWQTSSLTCSSSTSSLCSGSSRRSMLLLDDLVCRSPRASSTSSWPPASYSAWLLTSVVALETFGQENENTTFIISWKSWLPYILAYKSRNFGQNSAKILSIRLIHGSQKISLKMYQNLFRCVSGPSIHKNKVFELSNFGHFLPHFFQFDLYAGQLIREYIR